MPRFKDIPKYRESGAYKTHVSWSQIKYFLKDIEDTNGLDLNPDFQRGHVWTKHQQTAYVEHVLRGGNGSLEIKFNSADYIEGDHSDPVVIVDGLQRLTAVMAFLNDELPAFGHYYSEYEDKLDRVQHAFTVFVNDLKTRADILQWYLELNAGGTVHSQKEISRVQDLLDNELGTNIDAFQIVENYNGGKSLLKDAKSDPHTVVEVFYLDESHVTNYQNMIFNKMPESMNPGWFWQRMDVEAIHGPFESKDLAVDDFENNYDICYRFNEGSVSENDNDEAKYTDGGSFFGMQR